MKKNLVFWVLLILAQHVFGQDVQWEITVKPIGDSAVKVRWACNAIAGIESIKANHLSLHRFVFTEKGKVSSVHQFEVRVDTIGNRIDTLNAAMHTLFYKEAYQSITANGYTNLFDQEQERQNRLFLILSLSARSFDLSTSFGLGIEDTCSANLIYYELRVDSSKVAGAFLNRGLVVPFDYKPEWSCAQSGNIVELSWSKPDLPYAVHHWLIEKSTDSNFTQCSKKLFAPLGKEAIVYQDSLVQIGYTYFYRLRAIDFFADTSQCSDVLSIVPLLKEPVPQPMFLSSVLESDSIRLTWQYMFPNQTAKVKVWQKSEQPNGSKLIWKGTSVDTNCVFTSTESRMYVQVCAYDSQGDSLCSMEHFVLKHDTLTPAAVSEIVHTWIGPSFLRLEWKSEAPHILIGYSIYKSYSRFTEPVLVTDSLWSSTFFEDSISRMIMADSAYYYIIPIGKNFARGDWPSPYVVKIVNTLKPNKPLLIDYRQEGDTILAFVQCIGFNDNDSLIWMGTGPSSFRCSSKIDRYEMVLRFYSIEAGNWSFILFQKNQSGLCSDSTQWFWQLEMASGIRPLLQCQARKEEGKILAIITGIQYDEGEVFVYRKIEDGPFLLYHMHDGLLNEFDDRNLKIGLHYSYRVQVLLPNQDALWSEPCLVYY
jgi:hypothetical protein